MAKNKQRQLAIVRRLRGRRRSRTRIGMRVPILFAVIVIIAMVLDMCAFPPSRQNVMLAQVAKALPPVEKEEACQ
jgi:hypothetical protein